MVNKGRPARSHGTAVGRIVVSRIYWWSAVSGGRCEADRLLGMAQATVSVGLRQLMCLAGMQSRCFARGAELLWKMAGIRVGEELLRQTVHKEGACAQRMSSREQLEPGWKAGDNIVQKPDGEQASRAYVSADGVMVPATTQQSKDKRRQTVVKKRQAMPRQQRVELKPLGPVGKGSDLGYKQVYVTRIYDQDKQHTLVGVTHKGTEGLQRLLRRDAARVLLRGAGERVGIEDGAVCLRGCLESLTLQEILLDFYHLSEHVALAAKLTLGTTPQAQQWTEQMLHTVRHAGYEPFHEKLMEWRSRLRGQRRKAADQLINYGVQRREMIRYDLAERMGWDVGSGPMESQCGATTDRIKGQGRRWDIPNAVGMMSLEAFYQSNLWETYWNAQLLPSN